MAEALRSGNVLETVTAEAYPVIGKLKETMEANGAAVALMSGSGPTVFGIYEDRMQARRAMAAIRKSRLARQLFLTTPYNNNNRRNG